MRPIGSLASSLLLCRRMFGTLNCLRYLYILVVGIRVCMWNIKKQLASFYFTYSRSAFRSATFGTLSILDPAMQSVMR